MQAVSHVLFACAKLGHRDLGGLQAVLPGWLAERTGRMSEQDLVHTAWAMARLLGPEAGSSQPGAAMGQPAAPSGRPRAPPALPASVKKLAGALAAEMVRRLGASVAGAQPLHNGFGRMAGSMAQGVGLAGGGPQGDAAAQPASFHDGGLRDTSQGASSGGHAGGATIASIVPLFGHALRPAWEPLRPSAVAVVCESVVALGHRDRSTFAAVASTVARWPQASTDLQRVLFAVQAAGHQDLLTGTGP